MPPTITVIVFVTQGSVIGQGADWRNRFRQARGQWEADISEARWAPSAETAETAALSGERRKQRWHRRRTAPGSSAHFLATGSWLAMCKREWPRSPHQINRPTSASRHLAGIFSRPPRSPPGRAACNGRSVIRLAPWARQWAVRELCAAACPLRSRLSNLKRRRLTPPMHVAHTTTQISRKAREWRPRSRSRFSAATTPRCYMSPSSAKEAKALASYSRTSGSHQMNSNTSAAARLPRTGNEVSATKGSRSRVWSRVDWFAFIRLSVIAWGVGFLLRWWVDFIFSPAFRPDEVNCLRLRRACLPPTEALWRGNICAQHDVLSQKGKPSFFFNFACACLFFCFVFFFSAGVSFVPR